MVESGKSLMSTTAFNSNLPSQLVYFSQFLPMTDFPEARYVVRLVQIVHLLGSDRFTRRKRLISASVLVRSHFWLLFDVIIPMTYCFARLLTSLF